MEKLVALDICKHLSTTVQTFVIRQGDAGSLALRIAVNEDGVPFDLSGYEARFMARLRNGKAIIDPCEAVGANELRYVLPTALTALPGTVGLCYIAVYRGEEWVASTNCLRFIVLEGVDIHAEEAKGYISEFEQLKDRFEGLIEEAGEQKGRQQEDWEEQMTAQQSAWQSQAVDQQLSWKEQTDAQQALWESQIDAQQTLWESQADAQKRQWQAQMTAQQAEFEEQEAARAEGESKRSAAEEERERAVADALASLGNISVESIADEDIDGLWSQ